VKSLRGIQLHAGSRRDYRVRWDALFCDALLILR
jgi:hypothetical protein